MPASPDSTPVREPPARERGRLLLAHHLHAVGIGAWLVAFGCYVALEGVPTSRSLVIAWALAAVLASKLGDLRAGVRSMVIDFVPLFAGLAAYDALRGRADDLTSVAHVDPQFAFDRVVGFGTTPTERLQHWLYHPGQVHWYDYGTWAMHISHFFLSTALLVVLWRVGSERFRPLLVGVVTLSYAALATYWLYPAVPPWMASDQGHLHHVTRVVGKVWSEAGFHRAPKLLVHHAHEPAGIAHATAGPAMEAAGEKKSAFSDPVAALPSLHGAIPMLLLLTLRGINRWMTALLACYVVAMGLALVYGGEHYVFDVVLGWGYALCAWQVAVHRVPSRAARRVRRTAAALVTSAAR
jgi:hypothetical protein